MQCTLPTLGYWGHPVSKGILKEGGPFGVRRTGRDMYELSVTIPTDADGRRARECPSPSCSPGYFKVRPGTGIQEQESAYCPYCRHQEAPSGFTTREQLRYAKDLVLNEAHKGAESMIRDALGLGSSGRRRFDGGLVSIEMSMKPVRHPHVSRPYEDEVRRDVVCPHCGLDQTVFGLASWCADCGQDIFLSHVSAELGVLRKMLADVPRREEVLGSRVAAKDLENCLEDAVSTFEAASKAIARRALAQRGVPKEYIDTAMNRIGNAFQNVQRTREQLAEHFQVRLDDLPLWERLTRAFEKRHPIAHNLGVVDRKYLERVRQAEREGRELRIAEDEVGQLLADVLGAVELIHRTLLPALPAGAHTPP